MTVSVKIKKAFERKVQDLSEGETKQKRNEHIQMLCKKLVFKLEYYKVLNFYPEIENLEVDIKAEVVMDASEDIDSVEADTSKEESMCI